MPSEITPSTVKPLLPTTSGTFCERMKRLVQFPTVLHGLVSYFFTESGHPSAQFQTDLCALGCIGGGSSIDDPPNVNMPAPQNVVASDDAYDDKIHITWDIVTPPTGISAVTQYKVYRSLATNSDPALATLIATVTAPTAEVDDPVDADLVIGTNYSYWVKATNGTETSAYSNPKDNGRALAATGSLTAISDLLVTQGFKDSPAGPLSLVWTAPSGATKYDVYRNTANDFATATKIYENAVPSSTENFLGDSADPKIYNNVDHIMLLHEPPNYITKYYFWVVAKKDSPPATSLESNAALGWVYTNYAPYTGGSFTMTRGVSKTQGVDFPGVNTKIRVVVFGGGAGGGGGSGSYGAGGGGGGSIIVEEFTLTAAQVLTVEANPNVDGTTNAATITNGQDGADIIFKIDGVAMITASNPTGGLYNAAGGGAGGAAGTGAGTTAPTIFNGYDGKPGVGAAGGRSGQRFGERRFPAAHYNGFSGAGWSGDGGTGGAGAGSYAGPGVESLATGGAGFSGRVLVHHGPP